MMREKERLGLVISQHCDLYEKPGDSHGGNGSEITDEIFSGWAVEVLPGEGEDTAPAWLYVQTHYGYQGYVKADSLRSLSEEELRARQDRTRFYLVGQTAADVLAAPRVQGTHLETLVRGSILELLEDERTVGAACGCEGWCRVRTAAGREGYVHAHFLVERRDDDGYLLAEGEAKAAYLVRRAEEVLRLSDETQLREALVKSAEGYLGAQYRWAGKSSLGLDCSGLTFMSYMQNGILLYRDAWIREAYPVREIGPEQLDRGDLIFFEGHVAMYLGGGRFIHSTGYAPDACVRVNSLLPEDSLYRPDLPEKILWYGSVFAGTRCTKTREQMRAVLEENRRKAQQGIPFFVLREEDAEAQLLGEITRTLGGMRGNISFFYQNLTSGRQAFYAGKTPHVAASVIKLYLMAALFKSFAEGTIDPLERVQVPAADKVPSCGVLYYLRDQAAFSVRDLIELMIIVSDNTATNLLFDLYADRFGPDRLSRVIREELGFGDTAFNRKMFDSEKAALGIENYTTAADTADLLGRIWRGELVSPEASAQMYRILKDQRLNGKIPFRLHALKGAPVIAHKTGEDTGTTHDVALIEGSHPMLLGFFGNEVDVPALERLMADAAARLYALG